MSAIVPLLMDARRRENKPIGFSAVPGAFVFLALAAAGATFSCGGKAIRDVGSSDGDHGTDSSGGEHSVLATGGSESGSGGAMSTGGETGSGGMGGGPEGEFLYLDRRTTAAAGYPEYLLYQFVDGQPPTLLLGENLERVFLVEPPASGEGEILFGYEVWAEGPIQFILSFEPETSEAQNFGMWGEGTWGTLYSEVDEIVALPGGDVLVLKLVTTTGSREGGTQQIWRLRGTGGDSDNGEDELLFEKVGAHLRFAGQNSSGAALFWDREEVIAVSANGWTRELELVGGEEIMGVSVAPGGDGMVMWTGAIEPTSLYWIGSELGSWIDASSVFVPSITWIDDAVWFEEGEETRRWSGASIETIEEPGVLSQPRGGTVNGDFGSALRALLPVGMAVAFVQDESVETCGPIGSEIFTLQPHVRDGVSGVLVDERFPGEPDRVGTIYFCAPGDLPIDLLAEYGAAGQLVPVSFSADDEH